MFEHSFTQIGWFEFPPDQKEEIDLCLCWEIYSHQQLNLLPCQNLLYFFTIRSSLTVDFYFLNRIQFSSVTQLCLTLCNPMDCSVPGLPVHHQLPVFTQTHVHRVSDAIQPSHLLLSSCPQSFPASGSLQMSQLFPSGGQSIGVSASTSVDSSNEHPGLISFRMDWLDLLAVQGTLKSLLQHHSSKASIPLCSVFFKV